MGLIALLVVELLFLSGRFDTATLLRYDGLLAWMIGEMPVVLRFGVVAVAALFLFSAKPFSKAFHELSDRLYAPYRGWLLALVAHLIVLVLFTRITHWVIDGDMLATSWALWGSVLWLGVGVLTVVTWAGGLARYDVLWELLVRLRGLILAGCLISATALLSGWLAASLWMPLRDVTLQLVIKQLGLFLPAELLVVDGPSIGTPMFTVSVAPGCSGYEGIGLIWVFFATYIWLFRNQLRFPHVFLLIPVATVVIWLANSMRITTLILIGHAGWHDVALGGFHSQAGWLAFCVVGLGMVAICSRSRFFARDTALGSKEGKSTTAATNVASPYLLPFLAILAIAMITGAFSSGADALYPLRVVGVLLCLWMFRATYQTMRWSFSWWAVAAGVGLAVVWLSLMPATDTKEVATPSGLAGVWLLLWWASRLVGYTCTVPIAEELTFRGYLTRRLISSDFQNVPQGTFSWYGCLVSALLFGLMHGQLWLLGTAAGLVFAFVYYRRGHIGDAVAAHIATNGSIAIYAAWSGDWSLLS